MAQHDSANGPENRARATRLLEEAIRLVPSTSLDFVSACEFAEIARALAKLDRPRAARLAADAERFALLPSF